MCVRKQFHGGLALSLITLLPGCGEPAVAPSSNDSASLPPSAAQERPDVSAPSSDRRAADWARQFGGTLVLTLDGRPVELAADQPLPSAAFFVREIRFPEGTVAVDDAGLSNVASLTDLRVLEIRGSSVTDAGVERLSAVRTLERINLHATHVTDRSLEVLASLPNLNDLDVGWNRSITDVGLRSIVRMKSLRNLNLFETAITASGLDELATLSNLEWLDLTDHHPSPSTLEAIRAANPGVTIEL
ncbi:MAG TPA: hypothetical protein DCQ98_21915 [Planctomycetaceae bacterium]|nr:hypothetical protein [Planctomycetaceae bacterium]HRE98942.1 hypothetical protein [Pirellulaceae bacterium]